MWRHNCPEDGLLDIGEGEPCNWCGAVDPRLEDKIDEAKDMMDTMRLLDFEEWEKE